jgi:peptidoglycan/xylan/chitin deacetylase (PgdA/CDA1 family)
MKALIPPIVMLHKVKGKSSSGSRDWSITNEKFLELLDNLIELNYQTVTFLDIISNKNLLNSSNKVVLTFDDGFKHLFEFAIPELVKRGMKASFYVPTAHIGEYNSWDFERGSGEDEIMNEDDLVELDRLGMEVGAHSHHHIRLKDVKDEKRVIEELTVSKRILESIIGKPVRSFAYPYGAIPNGYRKFMNKAGYSFAVSIYQPFEDNLSLRRFGYYDSDTRKSLTWKLTAFYKVFRALYDPIKKYD